MSEGLVPFEGPIDEKVFGDVVGKWNGNEELMYDLNLKKFHFSSMRLFHHTKLKFKFDKLFNHLNEKAVTKGESNEIRNEVCVMPDKEDLEVRGSPPVVRQLQKDGECFFMCLDRTILYFRLTRDITKDYRLSLKSKIMDDSEFLEVSDVVDKLGSVLDFEENTEKTTQETEFPSEKSLEENPFSSDSRSYDSSEEFEFQPTSLLGEDHDRVQRSIMDDSNFLEISKVIDKLGTTIDQEEPEFPPIAEDPFMHFKAKLDLPNRNESVGKIEESSSTRPSSELSTSKSSTRTTRKIESGDEVKNDEDRDTSKSKTENIVSSTTSVEEQPQEEEGEEQDLSISDFLSAVEDFKTERNKEKKIERKKKEKERKIKKEKQRIERNKKMDQLIETMDEFTKSDSTNFVPIGTKRRTTRTKKTKPTKKTTNTTPSPPEKKIRKPTSTKTTKTTTTTPKKKQIIKKVANNNEDTMKRMKKENEVLKKRLEQLQEIVYHQNKQLKRFKYLRNQEKAQNQNIIKEKEEKIKKLEGEYLLTHKSQLFELKCKQDELKQRNDQLQKKLEAKKKIEVKYSFIKEKLIRLLKKNKHLMFDNKGLAKEISKLKTLLSTLNIERSLYGSTFKDFEVLLTNIEDKDKKPQVFGGDGYDPKTGRFLGIVYRARYLRPIYHHERRHSEFGVLVYFNICDNHVSNSLLIQQEEEEKGTVKINTSLIKKIPYHQNLMRFHSFFIDRRLTNPELQHQLNFSEYYGDVENILSHYEHMKWTAFFITPKLERVETGKIEGVLGFIIFLNDVLTGLYYLHEQNLIHRDLRIENIGYSKESKKYVIMNYSSLLDISNIFSSSSTTSLIVDNKKKENVPPEIIYYEKNMEKIRKSVGKEKFIKLLKQWDVYSLGRLCYEMYDDIFSSSSSEEESSEESSTSTTTSTTEEEGEEGDSDDGKNRSRKRRKEEQRQRQDENSVQVKLKDLILGMMEKELEKRLTVSQVFKKIFTLKKNT